jgi:hypothetical protein
MRQLHYSVGKLIGMAVVTLMVAPIVLFIPLDQRIATGHVRGLWATLFYEIGPAGRWAFAVAIIGILLFVSLRSIAILFTDKIALRADESGIFLRTYRKRGQIGWRDVLSVDMRTKVSRRRTFQWVNVRADMGSGERAWAVQLNMLDADEAQVMAWISEARRLHANSRIPAVSARPSPPVRGFGRKRSLIVS